MAKTYGHVLPGKRGNDHEEYANILGMQQFNSETCQSDSDEDEIETNLPLHEKLQQLYYNAVCSSTPRKVIMMGSGLFGGWFIGAFIRRIGRTTAVAVGGGLVIIQVASHSGYIQINWQRIHRDTEKAVRMVRAAEKQVSRNKSNAQQLASAVTREVSKNGVVASAFVVGILFAVW